MYLCEPMKSYHLQQYTPIMTILALWLLVIGTLQAQSLKGGAEHTLLQGAGIATVSGD